MDELTWKPAWQLRNLMLERIDYAWERHRWYHNLDKETRPSDLFREHIWGCFIDDFHGVAARHEIGVGNILIEVDYPHSDSNWPNSRKHVAENPATVPTTRPTRSSN